MEVIDRIQMPIIQLVFFGSMIILTLKAYFHFKYLRITDERIKGKSIFDLYIYPSLWFDLFHVCMPIFFKSETEYQEQVKLLETKVSKGVRMFWKMIGLMVLLPLIFLLIEKIIE